MCLTFICIIPNLASSPKSNEASPKSFHLPFSFLVINCREEFYDRPTHPPVIWQRRLKDCNSLSASLDNCTACRPDISSNNSDFFNSTSLLGCAHCLLGSEKIEIKNYCLSGLQ